MSYVVAPCEILGLAIIACASVVLGFRFSRVESLAMFLKVLVCNVVFGGEFDCV